MATITMSEVAKPTVAGDRFVATGLFVLAAIFITLQVLAGEVTPFWGPPAVVYLLLGSAILWRAPRWLLIVGAAVPLLHIVTSAPFMIPGFSHPETPASFLPEVFAVIAVLTIVSGAIIGLRGSERRSRRPIAVVGLLAAGVAVVTSVAAAAGVSSAARQAGDVPVAAANTDYPAQIQVDRGGALWVENQDPFRHTFVVDGAGVRAEVPGTAAVRVDADLAPGTYTFFCDVPGHEDVMRGTLHVD